MPGICWYPAKCTGHAVNQGGTADKCLYSSLTEDIFLSRTFFFYEAPSTEIRLKGSFLFIGGSRDADEAVFLALLAPNHK